MHIVGYVTRTSSKREVLTQKVSKEGGQTSKKSEVNIKPDVLESLLDNQNPY